MQNRKTATDGIFHRAFMQIVGASSRPCSIPKTVSVFRALCLHEHVHNCSQRSLYTRKPVCWFSRPMSASASSRDAGSADAAISDIEEAVPEDLVQYIVLRKDLWTELHWPLGSVVAQACHASTAALWLSKDSAATASYCAPDKLDSMHKVCGLNTISVSTPVRLQAVWS